MKKFQEYLESISKTKFVLALLGLVNVAVTFNLIPANYLPHADLTAGIMLFLFQALAPNGILTKGQTAVYWVTTILTMLISIAQLVQDSPVFDTVPEATISKIITAMTALLYYWKYINGVNLTNKVAVLKIETQLNAGLGAPTQLPPSVTDKYIIPAGFMRKHKLAA